MPTRNILMFVLYLIIFSACSSPANDDRATTDSLMAEIFVDLHLARARISLGLSPYPLHRDTIIAHYGMTPADVEAQMEYYAEHPEAYNALQNMIADRVGQEIHSIRSY